MSTSNQNSYLDSPIEFLKGVGPIKGDLLKRELGIFTFKDLLFDYPFRYVDKTSFQKIKDIQGDGQIVQVKGKIKALNVLGQKRGKRLVAIFGDDTGAIELVWFKGVKWLKENLSVGQQYVIYGKVNRFKNKINIPHPEIEIPKGKVIAESSFVPVYHSGEKLSAKGLDAKGRRKLVEHLLEKLKAYHIPETLPDYLIEKLKMMAKFEAIKHIHFPANQGILDRAKNRLKFEELFFMQVQLLRTKAHRKQDLLGYTFERVGDHFNKFFTQKLTFELTGAQKRVIKEIRKDLGSGTQMNRLLQGDVGSGKTIVAVMSMLIALDNGYQSCLLAPTEILATQHYNSILKGLKGLGIRVGYLSGNVKGKKRSHLLKLLSEGDIDIIVGTHALIEDPVIFKRLGLAITDEQHRFGVKQRAKLWSKSKPYPPHILVMTATPIPRTLAMTVYGDLEVSVIDELPPGRKDIKTVHQTESHRPSVIKFMRSQIEAGRQIYVVYPLIEESEKLDLKNLEAGYEYLLQFFPRPEFQMSIVHGRMKAADKESEMQRFVKGKTQILVATTVIEVGVDVPNSTVMIIENTERFGLSQLHQLRGRVGRGGNQSYCILMTGFKLSKEAKQRINIMVKTNNGFEISEADLELRGPGDIVGTRQSGIADFQLVNLATDNKFLQTTRRIAEGILEKDPFLNAPENKVLRTNMLLLYKESDLWSRIS